MEKFDWNFLFELIVIWTVGTVIFSNIFDSFTILNLNFWDFENSTLNKSFLANMVYVLLFFPDVKW